MPISEYFRLFVDTSTLALCFNYKYIDIINVNMYNNIRDARSYVLHSARTRLATPL